MGLILLWEPSDALTLSPAPPPFSNNDVVVMPTKQTQRARDHAKCNDHVKRTLNVRTQNNSPLRSTAEYILELALVGTPVVACEQGFK